MSDQTIDHQLISRLFNIQKWIRAFYETGIGSEDFSGKSLPDACAD
ncbi:MAG TPA: hypothetical protein PLD20_13860 [Blastocatellia bacterium]|nr:hypothetical protein [Blastocatellia bacterium]HMV83712.1 hypothetical protein [Blastocatellia bacterium]HMX28658.1 hypothetical protein [Blastocatellia bacterium]HMZ19017.1 hypothetical protein [Blastocatellia bacterium]HNG29999.1 hypothetical protein [Blastocatellia bacterium]